MNPTRAKILIVDDAAESRGVLRANLEDVFDVVGEAGNGREAVQLAGELRPDIAIMDLNLPVMGGLEATQAITRRFPEMAVVILSGNKQIDSVRAAMAAGAREYFFKPVDVDEAISSLGRLYLQKLERARAVEGSPALPGSGIWAFTGAGGGAGRSTLLLGLANELLTLGRKVVVVDLDFLTGSLGFMLGLSPQGPGFETLLGGAHPGFGPIILQHSLQVHGSGLKALTAPSSPAKGLSIRWPQVTEAVLALRELFDYVLVDMPQGFSEDVMTILDEARFVFPVGRGDRVGLRNLVVMNRLMGSLGYGPMKVLPLATRSDPSGLETALHGLDLEVAHAFPRDDEACDRAVKLGQPVSRIAPKSPLTIALRNALAPIIKVPAPLPSTPPGRSILSMLLG